MQILIVDFGSQYTLVLARRLRDLRIHPKVLPPEEVRKWLQVNPKPKGIILSGGDKSVNDANSPTLPPVILEMGVPILGICYGMQLLAVAFGGEVKSGHAPKYGHQKIKLIGGVLFEKTQSDQVWASHGDIVTQIPARFTVDAVYQDSTIAAMSAGSLSIYGIQFHPEVTHTVSGREMIHRFVFSVCNCIEDWRPNDIISIVQQEVSDVVGVLGTKKAVLALSGGVDSLTLARTINFLGDNLLAVLIDTGGLREGEVQQTIDNATLVGINLKVVGASQFFLDALTGKFPAEAKRELFKRLYRMTLEREAHEFGGDECIIIQGTIAPDVIESGAVGEASLIKSHHNVNQPWGHTALAPFRDLFKFEIRALARYFDLHDIAKQMPFPGPGLYVRIIGTITKERLETARWATAIVTQILKYGGVYEHISQLVVALIGVDIVGIKGDHRAYGPVIVVRAVETEDYMTAKGYQIARDLREKITNTLCEHPDICRVWYDETSKPPGTIELE